MWGVGVKKRTAQNSLVIYLVQSSQREKRQSSTFFVLCPAMLAVFYFSTTTQSRKTSATRRCSAGFHVRLKSGKHLKVVVFFFFFGNPARPYAVNNVLQPDAPTHPNPLPLTPILSKRNRIQTLVPLIWVCPTWLQTMLYRWPPLPLESTAGLFFPPSSQSKSNSKNMRRRCRGSAHTLVQNEGRMFRRRLQMFCFVRPTVQKPGIIGLH